MNYSVILKTLSSVMWIMALAFSACAGVSAYFGGDALEPNAMSAWICAAAMSGMLAFALYVPSRKAQKKMFRKEAMCIIGLAWIMTSLVGAVPYVMILDCPAASAIFESTSGITTTGASVFSSYADFPKSLMFWRCLSLWIGGLGVVVFFVAILSFIGASGKILYANESSTETTDFDSERVRSGVFGIVKLYAAISLCCFGALKFFGMETFDAVCTAFSTVSTGGFSTRETSFIGNENYGIYWTLIFFMFVGGTGFPLLISLAKFKFRRLRENTEFWTYVLIAATSVAIVWTTLAFGSGRPLFETFTLSVFEVVATITSTGFCADNYQTWIPAAQTTLFLLMIVGGCSGSTAGGLKISRAVAAFRICRRDIEKSFRPRVVRNIFVNGKALGDDAAQDVLSYAALYAFVCIFGIVALMLLEPKLGSFSCISAVVATIGNMGPAFGELGCESNYGILNDFSKILLSMIMIMGRLEISAFLVLFMPSLWKKFQ